VLARQRQEFGGAVADGARAEQDRLDIAQGRGQRLRAGRVTDDLAGTGGHCGGARIAGDRPDLLAAVQQQLHQLTPDVARRSGNQDHGKPSLCAGIPSGVSFPLYSRRH